MYIVIHFIERFRNMSRYKVDLIIMHKQLPYNLYKKQQVSSGRLTGNGAMLVHRYFLNNYIIHMISWKQIFNIFEIFKIAMSL